MGFPPVAKQVICHPSMQSKRLNIVKRELVVSSEDGGLPLPYHPNMPATMSPPPVQPHAPVEGFYLREWRRAKKLTLEDLADRMNMHVTSVGNYETGKREPGAATIIRLAKAIGVSPGDLFRRPEDPCLDNLIGDLPASERAVIFDTVNALATSYRTRHSQID